MTLIAYIRIVAHPEKLATRRAKYRRREPGDLVDFGALVVKGALILPGALDN